MLFVGVTRSIAHRVRSYKSDAGRRYKAEGARSLREFLAICKARNIEPNKKFSGTFNVRVGKEKHQALAVAAAARGVSMNTLIDQAIDHELAVA